MKEFVVRIVDGNIVQIPERLPNKRYHGNSGVTMAGLGRITIYQEFTQEEEDARDKEEKDFSQKRAEREAALKMSQAGTKGG